MNKLISLIAGIIFSIGLVVSEMVNPAKVLAFLDLFGNWDPSLAFVMMGALVVSSPLFNIIKKKEKPLLAERFNYSNNKKSPFFDHKLDSNIKVSFFKNEDLNTKVFKELQYIKPDLIVLAGFLKKIPTSYIDYFKKRIINIHPSLLPKYGGKGMYGSRIHDNVIENNETETGITIHYVSEKYDSGEIIYQRKIVVDDIDTAKTIEKKIQKWEHKYLPKIIESILI